MRRFVLCLPLCYFVLVFVSPFSIAITLFDFACLVLSVSSSLGVWEGLRFVIVAFPGLFSYPFLAISVVTIFQLMSTDTLQSLHLRRIYPLGSIYCFIFIDTIIRDKIFINLFGERNNVAYPLGFFFFFFFERKINFTSTVTLIWHNSVGKQKAIQYIIHPCV